MLWASANRDEAVFGDTAEELVLDRSPNRHMTFGIGAHRCLGSSLARVELRIVMERVFERLPDFSVDRGRHRRGGHRSASSSGGERCRSAFRPARGSPAGTGPMAIHVTVDRDICQGHGLCYFTVARLFALSDEDGKASVLLDPVPAELW